MWLWLPVGLVGAFLGFGAIQSNTPEGKEQNIKRRAIELCWADQKRASLDEPTRRFLAGACEKMEQDYQTRYGRRP